MECSDQALSIVGVCIVGKLAISYSEIYVFCNETQYDITVNGATSLEYDVTVRADNILTGDISPAYNITGYLKSQNIIHSRLSTI